jgi:hypothetical protein
MTENSPTVQRWDSRLEIESPEGTTEPRFQTNLFTRGALL